MGSHKMKLVTVGLALATVAKALDCENGTVDLPPGSKEHVAWCNENAEKCKDSDVQVCFQMNLKKSLKRTQSLWTTSMNQNQQKNYKEEEAASQKILRFECPELG